MSYSSLGDNRKNALVQSLVSYSVLLAGYEEKHGRFDSIFKHYNFAMAVWHY